MSVLYVKEQGAYIQKRSERILITKGSQTLLEIPMDRIDAIAVIGNVQITSQALYVLMERGIDISLGYTFLTKEVSSALEAESFEMYLGFLHGIRNGRKSLPLDMVEEFRQPVIDRMTLKLFNKSMISEHDFLTEEDAVTLNEDGFRKFCKEFERWMTDPSVSGESMGYRALIRRQAKNLKRAVQKKEEYQPYCLKK